MTWSRYWGDKAQVCETSGHVSQRADCREARYDVASAFGATRLHASTIRSARVRALTRSSRTRTHRPRHSLLNVSESAATTASRLTGVVLRHTQWGTRGSVAKI